ncbi:hypothetical protein ACH4SP_23280 [Streptomyces sp. NPDC021093]|uniref:hypothetical protein n=1 Tax=Streptomyces sp. NPDC021093 TaxID=3365112 RepID=UPI0037B16498
MAEDRSRLAERRMRIAAFGGLGVFSLVVFGLMVGAELERSDPLSSVLSFFVGCGGLALSVADYFRGRESAPPDPAALADELCRSVEAQWTAEARSRRLDDPRVLPLAWSTSRRRVGDRAAMLIPTGSSHAPAVPATVRPARVVRQRLDGRLHGSFGTACAALAGGYRDTPGRRLLLLGEPGAGKSALALMVTVGLAKEEHRAAGGPVPVLLAVASWDSVVEPLDDWMVRRLADMYYAGRSATPRLLLDQGLLVPVLDGLDEIPEAARRRAVRGLNRALGCDRPVIVTCRSQEYEDVVKDGAPRLRGTPVVEIAPVAPRDAIAYLSDVVWPERTDWEPVYRALRERPDSAVAQALSTPLMVSLARLAYERNGEDPGVLADETRLDSRYAVEDHVTAGFVASWQSPQSRRVAGGREREWLSTLALYLHRHRERDLVWWRMPERLLSVWAGPTVALVCGLVLTVVAVALRIGWTPDLPDGAQAARQQSLEASLAVGAVAVLLAMVVWWISSGRPPGRLSLRAPGTAGRLRKGFRSGWSLTALPAGCVLVGTVAVLAAGGAGKDGVDTLLLVSGPVWTVVLATSIGLAAHEWLNAAPVTAVSAHPASSLRDDRNSALIGAAACGLGAGLSVFPLMVSYRVILDLIAVVATGPHGEPPLTDLVLLHMRSVAAVFEGYADGQWHWPPFVRLGVLTCGCIGLLALLPRAWTRFLVFRIASATTRRLPWRLMGFLEEAHRGGILRYAGGHYQFRHIRLQDALAQDLSPEGPAASGPAGVPGAGRRIGRRIKRHHLLGALALVCAVGLAVRWAYPEDTSRLRLTPQHPVTVMKFMGSTLVTGDGLHTEAWDGTSGKPLPVTASLASHRAGVSGRLLKDLLPKGVDGPGAYERTDVLPVGGFREIPLTTDSGRGLPSVSVTWIGGRPRLALKACSGPLEVWEILPGKRVYREPSSPVDTDCHEISVLSDDLRTVAGAGSFDRSFVQVRRVGEPRARTLREGPWGEGSITSAALSPDGARLAVGEVSGALHLIDTATLASIGSLTGHRREITALAFNADGSRIAAYADGGEVRVWSTP